MLLISSFFFFFFSVSGSRPGDGVPDMTIISDIDEHGINKNLQVRYDKDNIYVSDIKDGLN